MPLYGGWAGPAKPPGPLPATAPPPASAPSGQ